MALAQPASLEDLLLYRLNRVLRPAGGMVIRLCEGRFGVTRREWAILGLLGTHEDLISSQLAELAQLDRARTSRAVTSLVAKQLVRRQAGSGDRRHARLALTPQGRALYDAIFPVVRELNTQLLAVLSPSQVAQLDDALQRLQVRAHELAASLDLPKADRRRGGARRAA
ncbi:MAG TPA: MarR family transcriptional regulator [Ramlibacter sp.]|nr:MarR family transcriptional regulator [Ramlibacter sp.]